jgi:hypothetical protein
MHTKGKIVQEQNTINSIDIISQKTKRRVAQVINVKGNLHSKDFANAERLVLCWNQHDALVEVSHNLAETMGVDYAIKKLSGMTDDNMAVGASVILGGIQRQAKAALAGK